MIRTVSTTDIVPSSIELLVKNILDGIAVADQLSCNYTLEISRDDVAVIAHGYKHISNIEFS